NPNDYMRTVIRAETERVMVSGRLAQVCKHGCGPAKAIQDYLVQDDQCDHTEFTLLDFNDETIEHSRDRLEELKRRHQRTTPITFQKKSVHQLLKATVRPDGDLKPGAYDLVYCAGLFDYMS